MLYRLLIFALLMATWLAFSGLFDVFHISLGVLSSAFVTWISSDLLFDDRSSRVIARVVQGVRLACYFSWMIWQIVLSNINILRLTLYPGGIREVQPRIVKLNVSLKSDFEKFLLANSITLTPGTITVKILGNDYYVHAISEHAAKGLDGEMERRIAAIFAEKPAGSPSTEKAAN